MSEDEVEALVRGIVIGVIICAAACIGIFIFIFSTPGPQSETKPCNCTISYNGNNVSVEDALELAGEGLTVDQADEVKILIEEYCNDSR